MPHGSATQWRMIANLAGLRSKSGVMGPSLRSVGVVSSPGPPDHADSVLSSLVPPMAAQDAEMMLNAFQHVIEYGLRRAAVL